MTDAPTAAPARRLPSAAVTAVVVTRGVTEYLPATLAAVAAQTRPADRVLVVDAGEARGEASEPALGAVVAAAGLPGDVVVVDAAGARTFGAGVRRALADDGDDAGAGARAGEAWLWLLHDDAAPEPGALAALVHAVEAAPSVAVAGAKQRAWGDSRRLLEVGVTTSRFGRRVTGIDSHELDQGQHDGREDVLAVGLAGALVRRDVWDALDGPDPALGPYGDGLDLCRRARLAGHRVVVVPAAVVHHAQASVARPLAGAVLNRPGWDARRSAQARRSAYLHAQLTGVPLPLVPVVAVLAVVSAVVRALGRFVTKEPHLVVAELLAPWPVLLRPLRVVRARRRARRTRRLPRRALRDLQVSWREVASAERDRRLAAAERRRVRQAPSELEIAELAQIRRRRRGMLGVVLVAAAALTAATLGPLVAGVVAGEGLTGGSTAGGDAGPGDVWAALTSSWVPGGLGRPGPADPLLVALLPLTALAGTLDRAVAVVLLGALVLAAWGAWAAAGAVTRSVLLRTWAALVWVATPAVLLAVEGGRLGGALAHAALPWVALGVARGIGVARVDGVESGLVGARRTTPVPGPARGAAADAADADSADAADDVDEAAAGDVVAASAAADDEAAEVAVRATRTAEPSLAATAGAGLALVVVVAGAPVLAAPLLLALLLVAVVAPRRRRLLWVGLPTLALLGPHVVRAVATWDEGGWRLLLADPGRAVPSTGAPAWQQLLGWPVAPPAWVVPAVPALEPAGAVLPFVATGGVVLVACLALVAGGGAGRTARLGLLVGALGLVVAAASARLPVAVADVADGAVLATPWPGSGVSLALLGLLAAALAGATTARAALAHRRFGWRQVLAAVVALVAVLGPAATLTAWTVHVRGPDGSALATAGPDLPAVGRQMQRSPEDLRVLQLAVLGSGEVRATLLGEDGRQLTELARATPTVVGPPLAARPAAPDAAEAEVAAAAARLAAGSGADVAQDLARLGVGAVLVPADAPPDLVGRVDSTLGLERMTQTDLGTTWRVAAAEVGTTAAWARLAPPPGDADDDAAAPVALAARDGRVDARVEPGPAGRTVVLAERAHHGWQATLDGRPLRAVEVGWRQAFELPAEGGRLVVEHAGTAPRAWLAVQGAVLLMTVLLALPVRRRRGGAR